MSPDPSPATTDDGNNTNTLVVVATCALLVALVWLFTHQPSLEETSNLSLSTSGNVFKSVSQAAHVPLYFVLLEGLATWFDSNVNSARIASLIFYLIMLPVAYLLGKRVGNDRQTAGLAAILVGLSPFVLWFSSKVTPFSLLALMTVLNQYYFAGILLKRRLNWVGYILSGIFGLMTHYFFSLVLLIQSGFYLAKRREFSRQQHLMALTSFVAYTIVLSVWISYATSLGHFWENIPEIARPSATDTFITFVQFLFGFQSVTVTTLILSLWPLMVVVALLAVQKYMRPPILVQYFAWAAFLPVFIAFGLSWIWQPVFLSSYLIICLPAFMFLISWFLTATNLRSLVWVRHVLLVSMAITLIIQFFVAKTPIQDSHPATRNYTSLHN